jgi:putative ABC transport system permease protein
MIHDIRYAIRTHLRRPAFATLVVATLGLGIGANTAMFSIVNSVLIEPLPFERPDELVYVYGAFKGGDEASISPPDFLDYRGRQTVFSSFAARTIFGAAVLSGEGEPERVQESIATANFFSTLGVRPLLGRSFLPAEERGSHDVAVLSYGLWQRRFAGSPDVVGTAARIDGRPHTIVGVMPPVLDATFDVQVWRPVPFGTSGTSVRRFHYLRGLGRLAPGVTLAGAQRQLDVIAKQLERTYPENETWKTRLVPYRETVVGDVGRTLVVLLCAVGLVLLIACGNVASLMLARATTRTGEIGVRTALGASRWRLLRQLLVEGFTLGLTAGAAGLAVAYYLVRGVRALGAGIVPRLAEIEIDQTALLFTFALSLVTSLLFGLAPALRAVKSDVAAALRSAGKGSAGGRRAHTRNVVIVAQVAVSFVLLIVAGLLIRSLGQLQRVEPGFDPAGVFTAEITLPQARYETRADAERFWTTFTERLRAIPGVESIALTSLLPLRGGGDTYFHVDGRPPASDADRMNAIFAVVTDDYFEAMRIAVKGGRTFTSADRADAPGVMVINEGLARRLFPGASAVGKRLVVDFGTPFVGEIVGVVDDVRANGQANAAPHLMYFSLRQPAGFWVGRMRLVTRVRGDETAIAPHVRAVLEQLEPDIPLASPESMNEILSGSVSDVRFRTRLLASFAAAALLLAVIGLYGVLAYSVTQRTRELGIRMALGARSAEVFQLVTGEGMLLVGAGVALGLVLSFAATRLVAGMLFEVGRTDLQVFATVTVTLLAAGLAACVLPARRATRVQAMDALRSE